MGSEKEERYELAEPDLKSFTRSSVRMKIMLTIIDEGKTVGELEKITNTRSTTLLHSLKDMMDLDLVEKKHLIYKLTNIGKIQALILEDLLNTMITLNQHHNFWRNHDMSGIPLELKKKIGMLGKGEIINDSPETPLKSLDYFISALSESEEVKGVSPILVTGYPEAIAHVVEKGADVEIIITRPVLKAILSEERALISRLMQKDNFRLFLIDNDVMISFLVTESFLNLGLSRLDGSYDLGTDLVYSGERAVLWGKMLYDYYRSQSTQLMDISNYT